MIRNLLLALLLLLPLAGCDSICTCRTCKLCISL